MVLVAGCDSEPAGCRRQGVSNVGFAVNRLGWHAVDCLLVSRSSVEPRIATTA